MVDPAAGAGLISTPSYDVIIAGGGPAGSTAGITLAQQGKKVLILEREKFPRFHIGESLLPYGNDLLKKLGIWEQLERDSHIVKPGADFVPADSQGLQRSDFGRFLGPEYATAFQVDRASFDQLLLDRAREVGCEVHEETRAEIVALTSEGVTVKAHDASGSREVTAGWLVDATGRDILLGRREALPRTDLNMEKKIAVYAHFEDVRRNEGKWAGNITIVRRKGGWFWIIPLRNGITSVGLVQMLSEFKASGLKPEEFFLSAVESSAEMVFRMKSAAPLGEWHVTSDYTFRHRVMSGSRWILVGDAAGFIDPIFSSGVRVAMQSGHDAAQLLVGADGAGRGLSWWERRRYQQSFEQMTGTFLRMIRMFYDDRGFEVFLNPTRFLGLQQAVVDIVGGNGHPSWSVRCRQHVFFTFCRLQRWFRIVPPLPLFKASRGDSTPA